MIRGNLVRIFRDRIELSSDLIRPLGIRTDVAVYGIYNPPSRESDHAGVYDDVRLEDDFVFTSIPYELWPFLARLTVFLRHTPGSLFKISEVLNSNSVNIIAATATRFGHRCAQWTMIVGFEDLHAQYKTQNPLPAGDVTDQINRDIITIRQQLEDLHQKEGNVLFHSRLVEKAVSGYPLENLSRFYVQFQEAGRDDVDLRGKGFMGSCKGEALHINHDSWSDIITGSGLLDDLGDDEPCYGIASLDTHGYLFRVAAIRKKDLPRFRIIMLPYKRNTTKNSGVRNSQGMIMQVTSLLQSYNLWKVETMMSVNRPSRERGMVEFVIECMEDNESDYQTLFEGLKKNILAIDWPEGIVVPDVKMLKVSDWMEYKED